jgi:hypothetical protein
MDQPIITFDYSGMAGVARKGDNLKKHFDYGAMSYEKLLLVEQTVPIAIIHFV